MAKFNPKPKPRKNERTDHKTDRKDALSVYRRSQAALAKFRDDSLCVICYFEHHRRRHMDEVHHVYGRGKEAGDWRESYQSLMCVCRTCHPPPVVEGSHLAWVEDLLHQANQDPISINFRKLNRKNLAQPDG